MGRSIRVGGVVLAAGESARMGQAKALVELGGRSFVVRGVGLLRAAGCDPVLVVDGAHRLPPLADARVVHNPSWSLGPLASLQRGLLAALELEPGLDALVVHHVERPRVAVATVTELIALAEREPMSLVQPRHAGRSGHPMVWPRDLFDALLALDPARDSARTLVRGSAAARRCLVDVDDPGVIDNIDTPAELAKLTALEVERA